MVYTSTILFFPLTINLLANPLIFSKIIAVFVRVLRHAYCWVEAAFVKCRNISHILLLVSLTLNISSLGRQRCLPSWGPRRTPWFFL